VSAWALDLLPHRPQEHSAQAGQALDKYLRIGPTRSAELSCSWLSAVSGPSDFPNRRCPTDHVIWTTHLLGPR
jgi:hypothetical protein